MLPTDPLVRAFRELVERGPDGLLVVGAEHRSTVGEVARLRDRIDRKLADAKLDPGSIVGFSVANGPAFLAGLLACLERGIVPLLLDSGMPGPERERAMVSCGASGLLRCSENWPSHAGAIRVEPHASGPGQPVSASPGVVIKLSSGSTGDPRGIVTPTRCLIADDAALTASMGLHAEDRLLAMIPFSHSYGLSSLVIPALVRGTRLVLSTGSGAFGPIERAREHEATVLPTVPAYLSGLLRVGDAPPLPGSLRRIISAGAPLLPGTAARFRERFGRPIHVFYGASESGGIAYDREGSAAENGTVGEPIDGVEIELVDGCVQVSSPAVADGYHPVKDPRLAAGRFVTGDTGCWVDGKLQLTGRVDAFIKVKGNKVNPAEVEHVIALLDGVENVHVAGVRREPTGDERVRAVVSCRPGQLTAVEVQDWCRQRLSEYKIPRIVEFVDDIPTDARGKPRLTT